MPIDPRISLGVQPIQIADPMARYSQLAAIQNAQQTNQLQQMQMREAEATSQERNALRQLDPSSADYEAQLFKLNPQLGIAFRKESTASQASQAAAAASKTTAAKNKQAMLGQAYRDISSRPSDANITAHLEDVLTSPLYDDTEKANIQVRATKLLAMPFEERKMFLAQQGATPGELKPNVQSVNRGGQTDILNVPAFGGAPSVAGTYADVPLPPLVEAQKSRIGKASAANITMGTEKKYGEKLAGNIADRDDAKLGAAEKAPELAASANRIIDLVKQGNLFTGPIADVKLNIARALNVVGADNNEKIANTESLIAATGQSTLDAIKSAGLGTGQGFTDKDLKFLQGIAGGTIDYTPQTLTRLATLQHQAATRSVQAWNTRFKDIPKSSVEGMGLRTAPDVPPLSPSAMFAKNPKTGERRQSLDGGVTWTPVGGK
jgi:hypothetical protein